MLRSLLLAAAWARSSLAALPHVRTTALRSENSSVVFIFQPGNDIASTSLISLNATSVTPNSPITTISSSLPFLSDQNVAFTPFVDSNGTLYAISGQCAQGAANTSLWTLKSGQDQEKGSWAQAQVSAGTFDTENPANAGGVNYLAAGFVFSSPLYDTPTLYSFGGMCPNASISSISASSWQASANYSNALISLAPQGVLSSSSFASVASKDDQFKLSPVLSSRGPPIPEAGFSATSLTPLVDGPNDTSVQQNVVLIGGQTAEAFLNMSQVAMLSLPEQSWSFIPIHGAGSPSPELIRRQSPNIEPRSGHTAVLSEDGTQIVVVGGWVGDIDTPAEPQLAVLQVGQDYGGRGAWQWSVPNIQGVGFAGNGIYGHGATLLPGNVMMIVGGTSIMGQGSKAKRDAMGIHFFNVTSSTWSTNYQNPLFDKKPSSEKQSSGLQTGQKIGLGVGLGVGIPLFLLLLAAVFIFRIRKKRKDRRRSDLIDRALNGSENLTSEYPMHVSDSPQAMVESRPASQLLPQHQLGHSRESSDGQGPNGWRNVRSMEAERTGLLVEIPSPTRGLRRGHSRGNSHNTVETGSRASGQIPVIDEMDEDEQIHSVESEPQEATAIQPTLPTFELPELDLGKKFTGTKSPSPRPPEEALRRPLSDPFADPPILPAAVTAAAAATSAAAITNPFASLPSSLNNTPNETSEREARGWIEDWEAVRTRMVEEREKRVSAQFPEESVGMDRVSPLSQRTSAKNSDRTESSVSERSMHSAVSFVTNKSAKSSNPSLARNMSQRSSNLFTVLPGRIQRKPVKPPRRSLPQAGTVSTAVTAIQGTPPAERSPPSTSRSMALSPGSAKNTPDRSGQPRMPSFGTLQAESQALLGQTPRSAATPTTHLSHGTNIEGHSVEYVDDDEDEFPPRPNQRRSRGLVGSMRNVLSGRGRMRLNTTVGSVSSMGSPTVATVSSISPTRASTATPFSMLRTSGDPLTAVAAAAAASAAGQSDRRNQSSHRADSGGTTAQRGRPRRTASVGSAPWRRRQSGARDWDWHQSPQARAQAEAQAGMHPNDPNSLAPPPHSNNGKHSSSSSEETNRYYWRRSSPGAATTGSIGDDMSERSGESGNGFGFGRGGSGGDWDVESAVERRCVQVMFTVPRERLRVVNAAEGEVDGASVRTRPSAGDIRGAGGAGGARVGGGEVMPTTEPYDDDDIASYYQQARSVSGGTQHTYSLRKGEAEEEMRLRGGGMGGYYGGYGGAAEMEPMPTTPQKYRDMNRDRDRNGNRLAPAGQDARYSPGRGSPGLW